MGDRTNVRLTIRKTDQTKFETICGDANEVFQGETPPGELETVEYTFYEVNYADLQIEEELQEHKIPYDKSWDQGGEYEAGTEYHRIDTDGESVLKEFDVNTEGLVALDDVIKAFELGCVDKFIEQMKTEFHVISWAEQDQILSTSN